MLPYSLSSCMLVGDSVWQCVCVHVCVCAWCLHCLSFVWVTALWYSAIDSIRIPWLIRADKKNHSSSNCNEICIYDKTISSTFAEKQDFQPLSIIWTTAHFDPLIKINEFMPMKYGPSDGGEYASKFTWLTRWRLDGLGEKTTCLHWNVGAGWCRCLKMSNLKVSLQ